MGDYEMRHLVLLSALVMLGGNSAAGAAPAAVVQTPPQANTASTGEPCQRPGVILAQPRGPTGVEKLGELPPGDLLLAVLRGRKGCYIPVVVRKGYGAPEFNQSPRGNAPEAVKLQPRRD